MSLGSYALLFKHFEVIWRDDLVVVRTFARLVVLNFLFFSTYAYSHEAVGSKRSGLSSKMKELVQKLNKTQKARASYRFDSTLKNTWHYIPKSRNGLPLKSMTAEQRTYVLRTLKHFLSDQGFLAATTIMDLENILSKEESGFFISRDADAYYLELFGEPNPDSTWAMSFEGHHLSLNYLISQDRVVNFSPMFFGANPAHVKKNYGVGPKEGTRPLGELEDLAFQLLNGLSKEQKAKAVVSSNAPSDVEGGGSVDVPKRSMRGIQASKLSNTQVNLLRKLILSYVAFLPKGARASIEAMSEVELLDDVYFSWSGPVVSGVGHYYRIDSPRFLIQLANTQPDVSGNPANHVHALWQTRN